MTARVLVFATVAEVNAGAFEQAYLQVTERMRGTPGLVGDELLRDDTGGGRYILLSEWDSIEAFRAWEDGGDHHDTSLPLRPYWSGSFERRIYNLAARRAS
jgi:heme-degrading monooxygenase HmoA